MRKTSFSLQTIPSFSRWNTSFRMTIGSISLWNTFVEGPSSTTSVRKEDSLRPVSGSSFHRSYWPSAIYMKRISCTETSNLKTFSWMRKVMLALPISASPDMLKPREMTSQALFAALRSILPQRSSRGKVMEWSLTGGLLVSSLTRYLLAHPLSLMKTDISSDRWSRPRTLYSRLIYKRRSTTFKWVKFRKILFLG